MHISLQRLASFVSLVLPALLAGGCATHRDTPAVAAAPAAQRASAPSSLNLSQMFVPPGKHGRHKEFRLRASYITIHSTANRGATASQHARGMAAGNFRGRTKWNRTGYMTWHFTVDDVQAIQSLPLNIQGEHADHDGPGNTSSVGIEICEFGSRSRQAAAVERAARLTAYVMRQTGVPLDHVVPHYHWPQRHFHNNQKNCPRILLEGGRPGPKWNAFLQRVKGYL